MQISKTYLQLRNFQICEGDYNEFDYIFGMDEDNVRDLKEDAPRNCKAEILLLGDFDPRGERIIRDPYYVSSHCLNV